MDPEPKSSKRNFVLLCSDADFSRAVMRALARRHFLPQLVVLPEFAPAASTSAESDSLLEPLARRHFPSDFDRIEFAYAPASQQADCAAHLKKRGFGFMLVACWPYLLQNSMLESVECAALNLHPSLLPAYRGADPIGTQLQAGDFKFGVTLHQLDSRFDQGDIIAQQVLPPTGGMPSRSGVEVQCAEFGVELFLEAMQTYPDWRRRPQPP